MNKTKNLTRCYWNIDKYIFMILGLFLLLTLPFLLLTLPFFVSVQNVPDFVFSVK